MKKLLIALGCVAAVILMSSCSSDSLEETENTMNKKIQETLSTEVIDSLSVTNSIELDNGDGDTDKDKT